MFSEASQVTLASFFALLSLSVLLRGRIGLPRPVAIFSQCMDDRSFPGSSWPVMKPTVEVTPR